MKHHLYNISVIATERLYSYFHTLFGILTWPFINPCYPEISETEVNENHITVYYYIINHIIRKAASRL